MAGTELVERTGNGCSPSQKTAQASCDGKGSCVVTFKHGSGCCCDSDDDRTGYLTAICQ